MARHRPRKLFPVPNLPFPVPNLPAVAVALLGGLIAGPAGVRADEDAVGQEPDAPWDYSRFSDGPRRVPAARGAALERAGALGLGTRRTAARLLADPPLPRWVAAARGSAGEGLHWPVDDGRFGRGFGFTRRERRDLRHQGVDIVAPEGAVVRAVADGIVAYSDNGVRGFGNCVLIVHPNGWVSLYAHNSRNTVQAGWRVQKGERIGFVGSTGISRGPHLHFELRDRGRAIDPARLFAEDTHEVEARSGGLAQVPSILRGDADEALLEQAGRRFSNLLWPVKGGEVGRSFEAMHRAIDVRADAGTPVRAAADGVVVYVGDELSGLGRSIVLLHRNGWVTVYGSSQNVAVEAGRRVRRGEWIAEVGETGASDGAHLHFELHDGGELRDPARLLVQVPGS